MTDTVWWSMTVILKKEVGERRRERERERERRRKQGKEKERENGSLYVRVLQN